MIYELALVAKSEINDKDVASINELVNQVLKDGSGEILVSDDWGRRLMAQPTKKNVVRGYYLYYIYRGDGSINTELTRRLKINESIIKYLFVNLGNDVDAGNIVKGYKTPFSKRYHGSITDELREQENVGEDMDKDRRRFARKRNCWFTAKNIKADWKDPKTYTWLVNEFGKIAPARISGISRKHQRFVTSAIKRARHIGIASNISGRIAE